MQIREATETDTTAIVNLLRLSLGESLMPKSENYWRWKHVENPFGPSPALLCWEGEELIGVRAFMKWEWTKGEKMYSAVRAVDTATHPLHQGKGIFKKLTLSLIDTCREAGIDFVFNTPNNQSKPGYLKMGWREAGKLPVVWAIRSPFRMAKNFLSNSHIGELKMENDSLKEILEHDQLPDLIKSHHSGTNQLITNVSVEYLKWRYRDVPVARYFAMAEESGKELLSLIIVRIKQTRFGRELRITDCFFKNSLSTKVLKKQLEKNMKLWDIDYCTVSGLAPNALKLVGDFGLKAPIGPNVTIRPINLLDFSNLEHFRNWSPSIGDLELF